MSATRWYPGPANPLRYGPAAWAIGIAPSSVFLSCVGTPPLAQETRKGSRSSIARGTEALSGRGGDEGAGSIYHPCVFCPKIAWKPARTWGKQSRSQSAGVPLGCQIVVEQSTSAWADGVVGCPVVDELGVCQKCPKHSTEATRVASTVAASLASVGRPSLLGFQVPGSLPRFPRSLP